MTIDLTTLPARLRARRGCRSLRDVAPEIGVSFSTLSRIEHGMIPNGTALAAIERWLAPEPDSEHDVAFLVGVQRIMQQAQQGIQALAQFERNIRAERDEHRATVIRQREEIDDLRAANHNYAQMLAGVRAALGAEEDADLAEAARALVAESEERRAALESYRTLARSRIAELEAESEGRRAALAQVSEERRTEWKRAERAESDLDWVMDLVRAYKAAVDAQSGVADAQAALFRGLEEVDHAQS